MSQKNESSSVKNFADMVYLSSPNGVPTDENIIKQMAEKIQCMMHPPAGATMAHECLSEQEAAEQQEKWLSGLATTTAGQKLLDHLAHMEAAPYITTSSAMEQAIAFRRVLLHALQKKANPFGLPKKLPKFLCVVNFSGERLFMYSQNPCLIAFLAMNADGKHPAAKGVQQILDYAVSNENCSVLLCYALPFQSGFESAYWDVRVLERTSNGKLDDSRLVCSSWDKIASKSTATLSAESQREDVLAAQSEAFAENLMACDLDIRVEKVDGIDPGLVFDEHNAKLLKMVSVLQNERTKLIADHKHEIKEINAQNRIESAKTCELLKITFQKQSQEGDAINEKLDKSFVEARELRDLLKNKDDELQQHKSDTLLIEETAKERATSVLAKAAELQAQNYKLTAHLKSKEKESEQALSKQARAHAQMHDSSERKLQWVRDDANRMHQTANDAVNRARSVEDAFEAVSNEKAALALQIVEARKASHALRFRLNLACARGNKLNSMMNEARMAHAVAEEQVMELTKQLSVANQLPKHAQETVELQTERDALVRSVKELEAELATIRADATAKPTEPEKPVMMDAETATVPITSRAELELGELQNEHCKLQDALADKQREIVQLTADLARARLRSKKTPPASFLAESTEVLPVEHTTVVSVRGAAAAGAGVMPMENGNGVRGTLQFEILADPNGDPLLESTIQQLQVALRNVADTARASKMHERAAREAFAKAYAYENINHMNNQVYSFGQQAYMYPAPSPTSYTGF